MHGLIEFTRLGQQALKSRQFELVGAVGNVMIARSPRDEMASALIVLRLRGPRVARLGNASISLV